LAIELKKKPPRNTAVRHHELLTAGRLDTPVRGNQTHTSSVWSPDEHHVAPPLNLSLSIVNGQLSSRHCLS
jgi:hypothetical protein